MTLTKSHFLISAPSSNSGKTTITLALLRALKNRGLEVQPFKCGPDYIDPIHHTAAAGKQSVNLDTFMSSETHVQGIYAKYSSVADVSVTEGVMGLFDGSDKMRGSSADIAQLLAIPVILVVNAKSMAYSAAPLLFGFKNFDRRVRVVGVIFNFVSTPSHYRFLKDACTDVGVEALGYLPQNNTLSIPSRHLGLHISAETNYEQIIANLAETLPKTVDLDRLLEITQRGDQENPDHNSKSDTKLANLKISIARDEAFTFLYQENIKLLSRFGEITWFSPLHDNVLPETDFLYLPGGYPELFAEKLSENTSMRASLKDYCEKGNRTLAECGGMMYLAKNLTDQYGETFPMVGVLDCTTSMQSAKMTLGYRIADWNNIEIKGHEFHYSNLIDNEMQPQSMPVTNAKGIETDTKIYGKYNTYASYMHLYWADNESFIQNLLAIK
ncbi:cobyrinate a,c-diamide synthase [Dyadobacter chenwenxiniae]|uniref:Cobyrinate a,c-diamide synthase n=1 Tax=Dyadobacter chenwenxiniae TaxID=2906456 RepID=A0A9X1TMB1_9BACT|nr:cobyrinate a,c-diamide synthase [Dyadobacter chenwenxiniae]MCF0063313.1 cobyrinate a,c-diamide synthase [Dyadobacter chenwenxiniae]UON85308.1 cobyrinate a,c-diamide synthase [Dyadobacter chenwenxiniae]